LEDAVESQRGAECGGCCGNPHQYERIRPDIPPRPQSRSSIQGIREAERGLIYQEFASKEHEILTGGRRQNRRRKTGNATLEIGKAQTTLVANEQTQGEKLKEGDTVKVYVVEVKKSHQSPQIMISGPIRGL
jgi:N utilization substance protein A